MIFGATVGAKAKKICSVPDAAAACVDLFYIMGWVQRGFHH